MGGWVGPLETSATCLMPPCRLSLDCLLAHAGLFGWVELHACGPPLASTQPPAPYRLPTHPQIHSIVRRRRLEAQGAEAQEPAAMPRGISIPIAAAQPDQPPQQQSWCCGS